MTRAITLTYAANVTLFPKAPFNFYARPADRFGSFLNEEIVRWAHVNKAADIRAD